MEKNRKYLIVFGIFALVIVTTAASFAFFTYSRVGNTTTTITSGDIEFTYKEGEDASLANAFPVSDSVGANDTSEEYTFTVNLKSSSDANTMNYNVYLLDANDDENTNYFNNEQIKFALLKDGNFVAGTSSSSGIKLSDINGFAEGEYTGEGLVLESQEIVSGKTDEYKLRIWISDDVNYSNTDRVDDNTDEFNDAQTSTGKYNGYKYSLKVKVTSGLSSSIKISNISVSNWGEITADISDVYGLSAYAVTQSENAPELDSNEWIEIKNESAKSNVLKTSGNVLRTSDSLITNKSISYKVSSSGVYYLHVKNKYNKINSKLINVDEFGELASTFIMNLAKTNTNELRIDEHEATGNQDFNTTEYRYYGATPNNYVWFNEELWRIIGVFDVDDGSADSTGNDLNGGIGKIEKRVKIIRNEAIGNYSWDSSLISVNDGRGVNEWSQADLMNLLNKGPYYNRTTGECFIDRKDTTTPCDFSTTGLRSDAKEMIGNAKWYTGAINSLGYKSDALYEAERGNLTGKNCTEVSSTCNDSVTRKTEWTGKVGLMYASDYGYAGDMNSCSNITLYSYSNSCKDTSWLHNSSFNRWTITPFSHTDFAVHALAVISSGSIGGGTIYDSSNYILPVVYLNYDIKIIDGIGTDKQPYILSK